MLLLTAFHIEHSHLIVRRAVRIRSRSRIRLSGRVRFLLLELGDGGVILAAALLVLVIIGALGLDCLRGVAPINKFNLVGALQIART